MKIIAALSKKIVFHAKKVKMGDKLIVIIPKNYHLDVGEMQDPLEIQIQSSRD
ncbi:MAG: hypothetical protein R3321_12930 [Nitrososphaeraceae archaeon]|nr:hypothetical protein [Nitrososphaeraceae archaeon]